MDILIYTDDCGTNEFEIEDHDTHFCLGSIISVGEDSDAFFNGILQSRASMLAEFLPDSVGAPELKGSVEAPSVYRSLEEGRIKKLLNRHPLTSEKLADLKSKHSSWARGAVESLTSDSGPAIHFVVTVVDKAHLRTWAGDLGAAARKTGDKKFENDPKGYFDSVTEDGQLSAVNLKIHAFYQHLFSVSKYFESRFASGGVSTCEFVFVFDYNDQLEKVVDRLEEYWKAYSVPFAFAGISTSARFELVDSKDYPQIQMADFLANVVRLKERNLDRINDFPPSLQDGALENWCSVVNTGRCLQSEGLSPTFKFGPMKKFLPRREM